MLRSMTGFGRAEEEIGGFEINIQVKAVNHRYCDITVKMPRCYNFLEERIRQTAAQSISRGKVEILISMTQLDTDDRTVRLNAGLAQSYIHALSELKQYGAAGDVSVSTLAVLPDLLQVEYKEIDEEQMFSLVSSVLKEALDDFIAMRAAEGSRLEQSLHTHLASLLKEVDAIEERSPLCVEAYREKLLQRLNEVLESTAIDESRIVTEAAIFADKIAVDEETVRLKSHIAAFQTAMQTEGPIGKKLDFIVQEMNREANTIGSKANDITVAQHVVELKSTIEKIREQIQNIE